MAEHERFPVTTLPKRNASTSPRSSKDDKGQASGKCFSAVLSVCLLEIHFTMLDFTDFIAFMAIEDAHEEHEREERNESSLYSSDDEDDDEREEG